MGRFLLSISVAAGLIAALPLVGLRAQDDQSKDPQAKQPAADPSQEARDRGSAGDRVEQALQAYRDRIDQNIEQTRNSIDRLREELVELTNLRCDLEVALAELESEEGTGSSAFGTQPTDPSSERARKEATGRELRQAHDNLRAELDRVRGDTDRLIGQVEQIRGRRRQQEEAQKQAEQQRQQEEQRLQDEQQRAEQERAKAQQEQAKAEQEQQSPEPPPADQPKQERGGDRR